MRVFRLLGFFLRRFFLLVRTWLFYALFYCYIVLAAVLFLPLLALPRIWLYRFGRFWLIGLRGLCLIAGISWRIEGEGHLVDRPLLIAVKHQSFWETLILLFLRPDAVIVLKRDLLLIPLIGWYLRKLRAIGINRNAGAAALRQLIRRAEAVIASGGTVVIFPEGTRGAPGVDGVYQPGIAALYHKLGVACIPAALNSGLFWPRRGLILTPGRIRLRFLQAIPPGLPARVFLDLLAERIETHSQRLLSAEE